MKKFAIFTQLTLIFCTLMFNANAQTQTGLIAKRELPKSRLELSRRSQNGSFYDVIGRKSAAYGYEHRNMEVWVYPMKIVDDFELYFKIEGYNLAFRGNDLLTGINVRPEATTFTYSHAAFTVKSTVYAPVDEQGLIVLLDINTTLPMTVDVAFRPKLALSWPGNLMTGYVGQDDKEKYYFTGEETGKFFGIIGTPGANDVSLMPYQEEPRDVPVRYQLQVTPDQAAKNFVPIVISGSTEGRAKAVETYKKLLANALPLYEQNVKYYENLLETTTHVVTPDERLTTAYAWAKIGTEKGVATNPYLGTGLLAGFRTSGDSERPGFAWYFGRDSMWTALATSSYGDFATTRTALDFLKKFQREDGKIPHEISQSATLVDWWKGYPYAWNSADATPLYIIVQADYQRMSGDTEFLKKNWESIMKAYKFSEATDTDNNGLIENTKFGHGWVEGGALYPPHEEIYMQGLWIEASLNLAEMAEGMGDKATADRARANAEKTRAAMEKTYWLETQGFYAYSTQIPREKPVEAEPGPNRARRQARLNELANATIYDEDTVLPAVPMWWRTMKDDARAQKQIDRLGSAKIATDWGARILANDSKLYDPLSYHYGSVWGLFTGWQSMAAYNYGRPHVGYQALMANSLLTYTNALGYVTELLSGDFNAPFGRSSHHQVWSEAMVISPLLRGMAGIEVTNGGEAVKFAPQIPANWNDFEVRSVKTKSLSLDFRLKRLPGKMTISITKRGNESIAANLTPYFPLDAKIKSVTIDGKKTAINRMTLFGDGQRFDLMLAIINPQTEITYLYDEGTDAYVVPANLVAGAESKGLHIIRSQARPNGLYLLVEGLAGQKQEVTIRSPRKFTATAGAEIKSESAGETVFSLSFPASSERYSKREFFLTSTPAKTKK